MGYEWNPFGLANLVASVLLFGLGLLFLKAKRSEFAGVFSIYCIMAAGQKFTGGVAFYLATDDATSAAWLKASTLFLVASTPLLAHALAAFVWGARRWTLAAWAKAAIYVPFAVALPAVLLDFVSFEDFSFLLIFVFLGILMVFMPLVALKRRRARNRLERGQATAVLAYLVIALSFSVEARVILFLFGRMPWWELSLAYTVATGIVLLGILRAHLFDVDLKVKFALKASTLAAIFVAAIFLASEGAQAIFGQDRQWLGILAGGALVFALAPLQKFADRVSDIAMPTVQNTETYRVVRKREVYEAAFAAATQDGVVTEHEKDILATLADSLGLNARDVRAIEKLAA